MRSVIAVIGLAAVLGLLATTTSANSGTQPAHSSSSNLPKKSSPVQLAQESSSGSTTTAQTDTIKKSKITFNQYIATTAPPFEDIKPAPGVILLARGIDRFNGKRAMLPIFEWTWGMYVTSVKELENAANYDKQGKSKDDKDLWKFKKDGSTRKYTVGGHDHEMVVNGALRMVPDQLFVEGPSPYCEEGSQATVEVIESKQGLAEMNGQTIDAGYDQQIDVAVKAEEGIASVGAKTTIGNTMMIGASRQAKEYSKSAKKGNTRSAFSSITSKVFSHVIRDDTSLSGMFKDAVTELGTKILSHTSAEAIMKLSNETGATKGELDHPLWNRSAAMNDTVQREAITRNNLEQELRMFTLQYGTDYVTHADMGGKVSQTISTKSSAVSSVDNEALTKSARVNFQMVFYKASAQKSTMMEQQQKITQEEETETFKEVFEGGLPNADWHEWCKSTVSAPVPIQYITRDIADLVSVTMSKPYVGERLAAFIGRMISKMQECEEYGQGLEYDKQSGLCKLGNNANDCNAGQFKEELEEDEFVNKNGMQKTAEGREAYEKCKDPGSKCTKVGEKGDKICRNCPRGKHLAAGGSTTCKPCMPGTFAENEGTIACQECPMGRDSNTEAQTCAFQKGDYYMQTVTNDGWEDSPGDSDRRNYMQPASLGQAATGIGDDDLTNGDVPGGQGWAYADAKDMNHKVTLKHLEGSDAEIYQITGNKMGNFLGLTNEGTWAWGSFDSTYGKFWAYFGSSPQYWKLVRASSDTRYKDYFFLESTKYSGVYLGAADFDDGTSSRVCSKETNCPWVVGGDRTHSGKCAAGRSLVDPASKAASKGMKMQKEQTGCANWVWKLKSLNPAAPTPAPTEYDASAPTPPPTKAPPPTNAPTLSCDNRNTRGTCGFWAGCDESRGASCSNDICICSDLECAHDGKCVPLSLWEKGYYVV